MEARGALLKVLNISSYFSIAKTAMKESESVSFVFLIIFKRVLPRKDAESMAVRARMANLLKKRQRFVKNNLKIIKRGINFKIKVTSFPSFYL